MDFGGVFKRVERRDRETEQGTFPTINFRQDLRLGLLPSVGAGRLRRASRQFQNYPGVLVNTGKSRSRQDEREGKRLEIFFGVYVGI